MVSRYLWNVEERVGIGKWGRVDWDAYNGLEWAGCCCLRGRVVVMGRMGARAIGIVSCGV